MQGNIVAIPLTIGEVLVSLIALFVPFWRSLELIVALISLTCVISIYFIPESPRWLIAQGMVKDAKEVILKAARQNDVETFVLPSCDNSERSAALITPEVVQYGVLDVFHTSILKFTLILYFCWPVCSLGYYALMFSADNIELTRNTNLSFIIMALVEVPACLIVLLIIDVWGRRPLFVFSLVISGLSCILAGILSEGFIFVLCVIIGKLCGSISCILVTIYTAELYPTTIRASMLGSSSAVARLGGIFGNMGCSLFA